MKVIKRDLKNGKIVLRLEVVDDLWYLSEIVRAGDVVISKTQRRIEKDIGKKRADRGEKKTFTLGVEVKEAEFDKNVDRFRIGGKIVSGPEDIPPGAFHTLNLKPGMTLTIQKETWQEADLIKVKDSSKAIRSNIMMVAIEDGVAAIGFLRNYGIREAGSVKHNIAGKDEIKEKEVETKQFFVKVSDAIEKDVEGVDKIIVAGPGFTKDNFKKFLQDNNKSFAKLVITESVSMGGEKGLQEIIKRGVVERVVKDTKIQQEVTALNEFFTEIAKDSGLSIYGLDQVESAVNAGAVKTLLITNKFLRAAKADRNERINNMIKTVEAVKSKVMIVSTEHDLGLQLHGLGDIASVLRYKI
jgi:protein pelota